VIGLTSLCAGVREILVFQPRKGGQAKAYQVQQLLDLIVRYKLEA